MWRRVVRTVRQYLQTTVYAIFRIIVTKTNQLTCHSFTGDRYQGHPVVPLAYETSPWLPRGQGEDAAKVLHDQGTNLVHCATNSRPRRFLAIPYHYVGAPCRQEPEMTTGCNFGTKQCYTREILLKKEKNPRAQTQICFITYINASLHRAGAGYGRGSSSMVRTFYIRAIKF